MTRKARQWMSDLGQTVASVGCRLSFILAATLALLAPTQAWAADFRATLHVAAVPSGGGIVTVSHDGYQNGGTWTDSSKTWTFTVDAVANAGYSFAGWFENANCSGTPVSESASYNYSIKVGTKDYDTKENKTIPGWYAKERTLYAKFAQHTHSYAYSISGNKITKTCTAAGCPGSVGGSAELTGSFSVAYDRNAHSLSTSINNQASDGVSAVITYSSGSAPVNAGTYQVTMKVDGGTAANSTITRDLVISPATISSVSFNPASPNYDGATKTTALTVKTANGVTLNANEYSVSGSLSEVGSPAADRTYPVTVTANNANFTGSASGSWKIVAPTGSFAANAASGSAGCTASGKTVTVTDSTKLEYDAKGGWNGSVWNDAGTWYAGLTVAWPHDPSKDGDYVKSATYMIPANARIVLSTTGETVYSGNTIVNGGAASAGLSGATASTEFKYGGIYTKRTYTRLNTTTWKVPVTPAQVVAARDAGETELTYSLTAYGLRGTEKPGDLDEGTWGAPNGIVATTYTLTIPVDDIVLNDQYGNQVYPALPYVANIGNIKYLSLAAALGAAKAGEAVDVYATAEQGSFTVPKDVTLNLGSFGAEGSVYTLDANDTETDNHMNAKLTSAKDETVTAVTGFGAQKAADSFTWTPYRKHQHSWSFVPSGATLTATCGNMASECDVANRTTSITLNISGLADATAPTATITGWDDFQRTISETPLAISKADVVYERLTDDGAACNKWYAGEYKATCVVTIAGTPYALEFAQFSIPRKDADKYASGWAVGSRNIRYDSWAEALAACGENDTIYAHRAFNDATVEFTANKDVTIDLCGNTVSCQRGSEAFKDTSSDMTLKNAGSGVVTLINGTIDQPVGYNNLIKSARQVYVEGKFAFGDGILIKNEADNDKNAIVVTVKSGNVQVVGGAYQNMFAMDGGSVTITGGIYLKNDRCKPQAAMIAADHICRVYNTGEGEVYQVVEHHHQPTYTASGNVITVVCTAADNAYCGYGSSTLTLTAADAKIDGQPHGASFTTTDDSRFAGAAIAYFKVEGEAETPLASAPSETGDYVAKVTYGGATAVAAYRLFHEHHYVCVQSGNAAIVATCDAAGSCDQKNVTLTLNAESRPWLKGETFAATVTPDVADVLPFTCGEFVYTQGGETVPAPVQVGDYNVAVAVTAGDQQLTLTKAFSITQPPADYRSGFGVGGLWYGSFAEARDAVEAGGTIYWRENIGSNEYDFTSDKDITIDFCGKDQKAPNEANVGVKNNGKGTVWLVNGSFKQAGNNKSFFFTANGGGALVLGADHSAETNPALDDSSFKVQKTGGTIFNAEFTGNVFIDGGKYDFGQGNGGKSLTIRGGRFLSLTAKNYVPDQGNSYLVWSADGGDNVVPHTHVWEVTKNGSSLSIICNDHHHQNLCKYGTLDKHTARVWTLTAAGGTATASGYVYNGASMSASGGSLPGDVVPTIVYNTADGKAPTTHGTYTACLRYGDVSADPVAFTICHAAHSYAYAAAGAAITATCAGEGPCGEGNKTYTATLSVSNKTYDGEACAATVTKDAGFPGEPAVEYFKGGEALTGAPVESGSYVAKMSVGGASVEQAFEISVFVVVTDDSGAGVSVKVPDEDVEAFDDVAKSREMTLKDFLKAEAGKVIDGFKTLKVKIIEAYALGLVKIREGQLRIVDGGKLRIVAKSRAAVEGGIALDVNVEPPTGTGTTVHYQLMGSADGSAYTAIGDPVSNKADLKIPLNQVGAYNYFKVVTEIK